MNLRHKVRYRFDNLLARGTGAALIWLGVVTIVAVLVSAMLLAVFGVTFSGSASGSWFEDGWQSLLRILDTGTMAGDVGWGRRILALLVTLFGVLVAGTLIGIIAAGVEDRIDAMRRGRSVVIESGHIVILGGSSRIPMIVKQLVLANAHTVQEHDRRPRRPRPDRAPGGDRGGRAGSARDAHRVPVR